MPFVSEELFQRLPRADATPSICVAAYPQTAASPWRNEPLEHDAEFVQRVARIIRSARSDYNIPNKTKTDAYVVSSDATTTAVLQRFADDLATQAYCGAVRLAEAPPAGCAILTVSAQCEVHLLLRGLIDEEKELAKLKTKLDALSLTVGKLEATMAAADYGVKVPAKVQEANVEKLGQSRGELERIGSAMETLRLM